MTPVPVVCDDCHQLWITESLFGVEGGGAVKVTLENTTVKPCPYCGGTGRVPDGVYELRNNAAHYFGDLNAVELRTLLEIVKDAQRQTLDADVVAARIEAEVPAASPVAGLVRNSGSGLLAWLTLLVAVLTLLRPLVEHRDKPLSQQQMEQAFEQAMEHVRDESKPNTTPGLPAGSPPRRSAPAPRRNDPCWCGSGKKFKRCHGG